MRTEIILVAMALFSFKRRARGPTDRMLRAKIGVSVRVRGT